VPWLQVDDFVRRAEARHIAELYPDEKPDHLREPATASSMPTTPPAPTTVQPPPAPRSRPPARCTGTRRDGSPCALAPDWGEATCRHHSESARLAPPDELAARLLRLLVERGPLVRSQVAERADCAVSETSLALGRLRSQRLVALEGTLWRAATSQVTT
jgi:hypothetical protein